MTGYKDTERIILSSIESQLMQMPLWDTLDVHMMQADLSPMQFAEDHYLLYVGWTADGVCCWMQGRAPGVR